MSSPTHPKLPFAQTKSFGGTEGDDGCGEALVSSEPEDLEVALSQVEVDAAPDDSQRSHGQIRTRSWSVQQTAR